MKKIRVLTEKNIINTIQHLKHALMEKQGHTKNVTVLLTQEQYLELCRMSKETRPTTGTYYNIPYELKPTEEEQRQQDQDLPQLSGVSIEEDDVEENYNDNRAYGNEDGN